MYRFAEVQVQSRCPGAQVHMCTCAGAGAGAEVQRCRGGSGEEVRVKRSLRFRGVHRCAELQR